MSGFNVAAVFSDGCVLQRGKPVRLFGECGDGDRVEARLLLPDGRELAGETIGKNGRWLVTLGELEACKGLTLLVKCANEERCFTDVAVGEVWLCGGQSNMEFELQNCTSGEHHLKNDHPDVRFYYTQKKLMSDEDFFEREAETGWSKFSPESAKCWSAVGYIFAEKLSRALGVTVGLIGCNWGGTSASCWMDEEALGEDCDTASYLRDYEKAIEGKSREQQTKEYREYERYADEWNAKYAELLKIKPGIDWGEAEKALGPNRWPGPMNYLNPFRPSALYHSMLERVCPYTLRGWLFYQGESDDHKPNTYYKLFKRMIRSWRDMWQDDAPFLYVQLPGHRYLTEPDYRHWCLIREAQREVERDVKDAYMICAIDAGEPNDIHPKDKEPIGERLYRLAMHRVYGLMDASEAESPQMESVALSSGGAQVKFDCFGGCLTVKGENIHGFELSGEDMAFAPASASLCPDGVSVALKWDGGTPAYVRYLWTNLPEEVNLYSASGLPAVPFRTDGEAGKARAGEIRQVMEL